MSGLTWWPHGFVDIESQVTQHTTRFKGESFIFTLMLPHVEIRSELQQYFGKGEIVVFTEKSSWLNFSTHLYYFISIFSCWAGFAPQANPMKMENLTSIYCTYYTYTIWPNECEHPSEWLSSGISNEGYWKYYSPTSTSLSASNRSGFPSPCRGVLNQC